MTDMRCYPKTFLIEFIQLYKSYPCLWKVKCKEYKDRNKKDMAYQILTEKLRELEPNATKETVKSKINSIRGSFRRETRKIKKYNQSGDIYEPHLWYYDLLLFTKDQDMNCDLTSNSTEDWDVESSSDPESDVEDIKLEQMKFNMEIIDGEINEEDETPDRLYLETKAPINDDTLNVPAKSCNSENSDCEQRLNSPSTSTNTYESLKRKRTSNFHGETGEIFTNMVEHRQKQQQLVSSTRNNDDVFDIFGKHIAAKLRTLPKITKLYTEKLINDLLFEAEMGNVDSNTKIVRVKQMGDMANPLT